ncbi:hypothetical protein NM688_g5709 [Phlebia brevispora]|uniref:Uncharacterized protein n=1 Tax=Phlebia brevispora TaxID=194682 RepID=A0ACC1SR37_9APHY|nr:hypothetical protein NM688_g5709 [Phlebia brevispora]
MDQDSFRKLLHSSASTPKPAGHVSDVPPKAKKAKSKKAEPSKPEFKPRTVKKQADRYRDRAEERRLGVAHDYAEVEALAEDFERRNADQDRALVRQSSLLC